MKGTILARLVLQDYGFDVQLKLVQGCYRRPHGLLSLVLRVRVALILDRPGLQIDLPIQGAPSGARGS